ncbi:hypothetical protein [Candidatus Aalborgicola defluviihabitans]|uniref:hypothetical protein n=1 Tax=Candidatus Aalborgicola defluviihabitans TaxID=3386187 RepID=UPI0039B870D1
MNAVATLSQGRYLLLVDILGFSALVQTKGREEVLETIKAALKAFGRWEDLNQQFKTIYFSDTFLFYQVPKGYGSWAFLDVYAIAGFILTALLAKGIAARGAVTFGDFEVIDEPQSGHQVYFGSALVEAHRAEQRENWIGITIEQSAWMPYAAEDSRNIAVFEREKVWQMRKDGVLLLNPFIKMRGWHMDDLIGEINAPYLEWDAPEFPNEIKAFKFIKDQCETYAIQGDFTGRVAGKYHATDSFLKQVFGSELYDWACKISSQ